jgi:hypothetical protein
MLAQINRTYLATVPRTMAKGRPPGRPLQPLELRHLRLLLDLRRHAHVLLAGFDEQIEDFVLELRDSGASARSIADAVQVGSSTVQTWTTNARRRR